MKWCIVNKIAPKEAIERLTKEFDEVFLFSSYEKTLEPISGHVDVFVFQKSDGSLIIAKNSPSELVDFLDKNQIPFEFGENDVNESTKGSTAYNCLSNENYIFHKKAFTDTVILKQTNNLKFIKLPQAFTRCSMIGLNSNSFITSDNGIFKTLNKDFNIHYFDPKGIELPGYKNGFLGGCTGVFENKIYLMGSLKYHGGTIELREFIEKAGLEIVELCDRPLLDVGSVFIGEMRG